MPYVAFLHTHKLVVLLFLLIYLVKTALLLLGKTDVLDNVKKKLRIPEMIISFAFLLTGAVMMAQMAEIRPMLWVKVAAVLASIPLAVIGFKRNNKVLATLSLVLLFGAYGLAEMSKNQLDKVEISGQVVTDPAAQGYDIALHGKALYATQCIACHGPDGNLALQGAKNLQTSTLSDEEVSGIIRNGKNSMPRYAKIFNDQEINALTAYVKSMRK